MVIEAILISFWLSECKYIHQKGREEGSCEQHADGLVLSAGRRPPQHLPGTGLRDRGAETGVRSFKRL